MKLTQMALVLAAGLLAGCHVGESTAPKPDPARFLPKTGSSAGGPPPSTPSAR